jgi:hypothetical protein
LRGAFDEERSARDFAKSEAPFAAPALTWIIKKKTVLGLEGEYLHLHGVPDAGMPPDAISFSLPVNRTIGEPSDVYRNENDRSSLLLTHQFSSNWMLTGGFSLLNVNAVLAQIRSNLNQPVTGSNANTGGSSLISIPRMIPDVSRSMESSTQDLSSMRSSRGSNSQETLYRSRSIFRRAARLFQESFPDSTCSNLCTASCRRQSV